MNVKILVRFAPSLFIGALACCAISPTKNFRTIDPQLAEIFSNPEIFNDKEVTFKAWVSLRNEDKNLWATRKDNEKWNIKKCISLIGYDDLSARKDISDGAYVQVTGTIVEDGSKAGNIIRLTACRNLSIRVDRNSFMVLHK
ncbi:MULTISPECIES: hypothetical protein [Xanthomonas]|nr:MULTISPECIES: hypothetical protein [Xanthomonas]